MHEAGAQRIVDNLSDAPAEGADFWLTDSSCPGDHAGGGKDTDFGSRAQEGRLLLLRTLPMASGGMDVGDVVVPSMPKVIGGGSRHPTRGDGATRTRGEGGQRRRCR